MSIYFPRAVDDPRALPELRAALLELATPDGAWHAAETQKLVMDIVGPVNDRTVFIDGRGALNVVGPQGYAPEELMQRIAIATQQADNTLRWYREQLPISQLIHISPEMTDFIVAAAEAVPLDMKLTLQDAPAPAGLVVFGKPVYGTDAGPERPGQTVRVDAVCWGQAMLPQRDVPWWDERSADLRIPSATIAMFRMIDPAHDDELAVNYGTDRVMWIPLGRTDWPWGDELNECPSMFLPNANPGQWASMMEDRRLLAALWATLNQKRLVDTWDVFPDKYARKRLERRGHPARDERVTIVHLRRSEYRGFDKTEGTGRHVSVRFMVKPFYRRQPYGPNRSLRRIVLIPAHWRGPEGAPVKHAERIWELDK